MIAHPRCYKKKYKTNQRRSKLLEDPEIVKDCKKYK